jgi:hypothetical protein
MNPTITTRDLKELKDYYREFPENTADAARLAINETVDREGMAIIKKDMRDQINFPAGYLEGDRLKVAKRASSGDLEAVIRGRDRATSLARFAPAQTPQNTRGRGVRVTLRNGQTQVLRRAFLINLRNGNTGLAVRLKPGETLRESQAAKEMAPGLWLLYGPSVDQVFRGVATDRADDLAEMVYTKFLRQFTRLSSRG